MDRQALSIRLLGLCATRSYDPVVDIDGTAPIRDDLYGLSPEWSTLYGTPLWGGLTDDQRVTLTIHEILLDLRCRYLVRVPADATWTSSSGI